MMKSDFADHTSLATDHFLHPSPLRRTAAVVRDGRGIFDVTHFDTGGSQSPDGGLASGARAADPHFDAAHAVITSHIGGVHRRLLGGEWRPFARPPEPQRPGTLPSQNIPGLIGDGHNRIVERCLNVSYTVRNVLALFLFELLLLAFFLRRRCTGRRCCCWFCHS